MFFYVGEDGLKPGGAFIVKAYAAIAQQPCAVQEVIDHYRFKNVELKMPGGAADCYGNIIAHNLSNARILVPALVVGGFLFDAGVFEPIREAKNW